MLEKLYFSNITAHQLNGNTTKALEIIKKINKEIPSTENYQKTLLIRLMIITSETNYKDALTLGISTLSPSSQI